MGTRAAGGGGAARGQVHPWLGLGLSGPATLPFEGRFGPVFPLFLRFRPTSPPVASPSAGRFHVGGWALGPLPCTSVGRPGRSPPCLLFARARA